MAPPARVTRSTILRLIEDSVAAVLADPPCLARYCQIDEPRRIAWLVRTELERQLASHGLTLAAEAVR